MSSLPIQSAYFNATGEFLKNIFGGNTSFGTAFKKFMEDDQAFKARVAQTIANKVFEDFIKSPQFVKIILAIKDTGDKHALDELNKILQWAKTYQNVNETLFDIIQKHMETGIYLNVIENLDLQKKDSLQLLQYMMNLEKNVGKSVSVPKSIAKTAPVQRPNLAGSSSTARNGTSSTMVPFNRVVVKNMTPVPPRISPNGSPIGRSRHLKTQPESNDQEEAIVLTEQEIAWIILASRGSVGKRVKTAPCKTKHQNSIARFSCNQLHDPDKKVARKIDELFQNSNYSEICRYGSCCSKDCDRFHYNWNNTSSETFDINTIESVDELGVSDYCTIMFYTLLYLFEHRARFPAKSDQAKQKGDLIDITINQILRMQNWEDTPDIDNPYWNWVQQFTEDDSVNLHEVLLKERHLLPKCFLTPEEAPEEAPEEVREEAPTPLSWADQVDEETEDLM